MRIGKQTMGLLLSLGDVAADRLLTNFPGCTYHVRVCTYRKDDPIVVWDAFHPLGGTCTKGEDDTGRQQGSW